MTEVTIYHNPRCSKSRHALSMIRDKGIEPNLIEYMKTPLSKKELVQFLKKLDLSPQDLLRRNETEYRTLKLDEASDEEILIAILAHPNLIERPIVVVNQHAVIARPVEKLLTLF